MDKEIRVGDWVTLDYERFDNSEYHGYRSKQFGLEPDKEYEVVGKENRLLTLAIHTAKGGPTFYKCFEYRVNLSEPGKEIVLWK